VCAESWHFMNDDSRFAIRGFRDSGIQGFTMSEQ